MIDRVPQVMEWNMKFLREKAENCHEQMVKFCDTVIGYWDSYFAEGSVDEERIMSPKMWYIVHLLFPSFGAISTNLLLGNPRSCFMELRLLTEGLACCYACKTIEELTGCQGEYKLMKEVDEKLELSGEKSFRKLWGHLNKWVHISGFGKWLNDWFEGRDEMHDWMFIVPVRYSDEDLGVLEELAQKISIFLHLIQLCLGRDVRHEHKS